MTHRSACAAIAAALALACVLAWAPATAAPPARTLPAPVVLRIPESAVRPSLAIDPNAPVARGEFATPIRTPSDRAAQRAQIERDRTAAAERFARGAGPGIAVRLRRSKY